MYNLDMRLKCFWLWGRKLWRWGNFCQIEKHNNRRGTIFNFISFNSKILHSMTSYDSCLICVSSIKLNNLNDCLAFPFYIFRSTHPTYVIFVIRQLFIPKTWPSSVQCFTILMHNFGIDILLKWEKHFYLRNNSFLFCLTGFYINCIFQMKGTTDPRVSYNSTLPRCVFILFHCIATKFWCLKNVFLSTADL